MKSLKYIFEPHSVAVIGASPIAGKVGYAIFSNILQSGFQGIVYPVNPKHSNILSVRAYENVLAIPDPVDMAVICVSAEFAVGVTQQCADKGIKGIVLITAGFKEIGVEGQKLEDEIVAIARAHEMALIGPNILGIINTQKEISLNANFAIPMPQKGNVALVSQSGAIGIAALGYAHQHGLGISKFVSIGNKAVIDEADVLEYLVDDAETHIITMYAEDIRHPDRFFEMACRANAKQKPVIIIKTGRSVRGAMATHSHTGALSSSDTAYDAFFERCGVFRVNTLSQLFEYAKGFTCKAQPKGKRIAVVVNGGGMGVIATDAAEKYGLEMTSFEPETLDALRSKLPQTASITNPVDIIGDADAQRLNNALTEIGKDKNVDAVIISILPTAETDMNAMAHMVCDFAKENPGLPVFGNLMTLEPEPDFEQILEKAHIPNYDFPETDIRALAAYIKYYGWIGQPKEAVTIFEVDKKKVAGVLETIKKENRLNFSEPEAYEILEAYGMKTIGHHFATDINTILDAAEEIGYPVVLKIVSPEILHKVDVGGVKLNLGNADELKNAFNEISESIKIKMPDAQIHGFIVEKFFIESGIEIIAGANLIEGFGSLIMFGLGGTFVELFKDVAFRLTPVTRRDAMNMIMETKGYQIIKGFRGQAGYDLDAIVDYLLRISQLVTDFPEIKELDLNPIRVLEDHKGLIVMDAKAVMGVNDYLAEGRTIRQSDNETMRQLAYAG